MKAGDQVAAHLEHKHWQRQRSGGNQVALQGVQLVLLALGLRVVVGVVCGLQRLGVVAGLGDGGDECIGAHIAGHLQRGALGGQVDGGAVYAGYGFQCTLDPAYARRAGHAFNG